MGQSYRIFSMRNPFARAVLLTLLILALMSIGMRRDTYNVQGAVMKAAGSAKQSVSSQLPLEDNTVKSGKQVAADYPVSRSNHSITMNCDYDTDHLSVLQDKYDLGDQFEYYKRYIKISRQDIQRKSMTKIKQKFLPKNTKTIDLKKKFWKETCPEPLTVPVTKSAYPGTANLSDFIFGVSTTFKRFNATKTSPINEWSHWLTNHRGHSNGGKLLLLLLDATDDQLYDAWSRLRERGIDADVYHSDPSMEMAVRYLTMVPALYNHEDRPGRKWIVTCDDDTFFPSPNALVEKMNTYDHTQPLYIGTFSEDVNNLDRHGSQAFGGAGVFLTVPMAEVINDNYDSCGSEQKVHESNSGWGPQGDILLRKCIYENSEVRLSTIWDLWQLDLNGDPSGFYESGIKPLSLHHYRGGGWHTAFPFQYTKIAHLCGEDCTLQRFQTEDDFVISTGFSIAQYPQGLDTINFDQFEQTFHAAPENKGWNLDFMFGPQRLSLLQTGRKIAWDLQESTFNRDGSVSQVYVRKSDDVRWRDADDEPMSLVDGIIELVWFS